MPEIISAGLPEVAMSFTPSRRARFGSSTFSPSVFHAVYLADLIAGVLAVIYSFILS
jgi:hypothetical protein